VSVPPFRVALFGYGLAGAALHAPFIAVEPGLELAAIVTRDEQRRAAARERHPAAELLDTPDDVWARAADLDLVVLATPNRTHVSLTLAALEAGLPVVVDKPLAGSAEEAQRLIDAAAERQLMLTVFQNRRWDGDFLTVKDLIGRGELGTVLRYESRFERWRPEVAEGWRESEDPADVGGVLYDLGSHLVDQALQLFGRAEGVYSEVDVRRSGAAADDDAFIAITHSSGVHSHLWMGAVTAQLGPRMRVLGDRAAYVKYGLDVQEAPLRAGAQPAHQGWGEEPEEAWGVLGAGDDLRRVPTLPGAYQCFYEGVVKALRGDAPPPVDPRDAVEALAILDAARAGASRSVQG
jgi:scyllo-inositol 2-dehydrogenase (NADP+)